MQLPDFTRANCIGADPESFFPEHDGHGPNARAAKRVCGSCAIQAECFEWALRHESYGIWGGSTDQERRLVRKQRNIVVSTPEVPVIEKFIHARLGWERRHGQAA